MFNEPTHQLTTCCLREIAFDSVFSVELTVSWRWRFLIMWVFPKMVVPPNQSSIFTGLSIINHPMWDIPIFGNTHMCIWLTYAKFPFCPDHQQNHLLESNISQTGLVGCLKTPILHILPCGRAVSQNPLLFQTNTVEELLEANWQNACKDRWVVNPKKTITQHTK